MDFNEEKLAFYYRLGLAITQWAYVEDALGRAVAACYPESDRRKAYAGFRAIENFRSKTKHADTVLSDHLRTSSELSSWVVVRKAAEQLAVKRNQMAHRKMITDQSMDPGRRVLLVEYRPDGSPEPQQKYGGAYGVKDIVRYQREFFALTAKIDNFRDRLLQRPEGFPKAMEQPLKPPTLEGLRQEIYAYARRPPTPAEVKPDKQSPPSGSFRSFD